MSAPSARDNTARGERGGRRGAYPIFAPAKGARDDGQTKFIYPYKTPERFKTNPSLKRTPSARDAGEAGKWEYISQNSKALAKRDKPV